MYPKALCCILLSLIPGLCLQELAAVAQEATYTKYSQCDFSIELPADWRLQKSGGNTTPGHCAYHATLKSGYIVMQLTSMPKSGLMCNDFNMCSIQELYEQALLESKLRITYKFLGKGFFVISGYNTRNGNIVYWKRSVGSNSVSDLRMEYREERRVFIDHHMGKISKSFISR